MKIHLHFFARYRDLTGRDELTLEVPAGSTLCDLKPILAQRFPSVSGPLENTRFAINEEYRDLATELSDEDRVALIPPVSGG